MTPKEKAVELVENYKGLVYPYIGSSMLTNEVDEGVILTNAKICATISVDEIISFQRVINSKDETIYHYWNRVKEEINKL